LTTTSVSTVASISTITVTSSTTLVSSATLTYTSTMTILTATTQTSTSTSTTTETVAGQWYGLNFMGNESNCAVSTDPPTTWYETPCFGSNADAVVFNCAVAANTSQGCTKRINTTGQFTPKPSGPDYFSVTVWYPYINYTVFPGANCKYTVPSVPTPPGPEGPAYAYCISLNSTAFIIAEQAPGPT
jgi:hypothetical protein